MRFLTRDECADPPAPDSPFVRLAYSPDSGKKIALAKAVMAWALETGPALIHVTEWGVWPSSEHMPLYATLRRALGDDRTLISAPGHLVSPDEREDGTSVLALALLFFWDVYVQPTAGGPVFFASHDEYAGFYLPLGTDAVPEALRAFA